MKLLLPLSLLPFFAISNARADTITVPGTANPWLAGAPNGTTAGYDVAPAQSPVLVPVTAGDTLRFYVSGTTGYASGTYLPPDGDVVGFPELDHSAENGIAGIDNAPASSLIGVFLDDAVPSPGSEPSALDYALTNSVSAAREATSHTPGLKQPFFIGNGVGAGSVRQTFTVPAGATRLFLGTLDGTGWFNNVGQFHVNITTNASGPSNTVSWSTPADVSGPSDVQTIGNLVVARNMADGGPTSSDSLTLNSVLFSSARDNAYLGIGDAFYELSGGRIAGVLLGSNAAPFSSLDGDYKSLLNTGARDSVSGVVNRYFHLTLNSLTIGDTYHVQFWVNCANESLGHTFGADNFRTVITTPSGSIELDPNSTNAEGGVGQWVTGTFIANEPGITFEFTAEDGGCPMLNAFQLRKEAGGPVIVETELPALTQGFTVTGGTAPYTFSITAGSLPTGLHLTSDGFISGSYGGTSSGSVTIRVTDSASLFSEKTFVFNIDLGLPELTVHRVRLEDAGSPSKFAKFYVTASDDVALAPYEDTPVGASLAIEYRYKEGAGLFTPWTTHPYHQPNDPPSILFDSTKDVKVELRAVDAAGNKGRTTHYDIKKVNGLSLPETFAQYSAQKVAFSNAGSSVVKLFVEDFDNNKDNEIVAVDRTSSTVHFARNLPATGTLPTSNFSVVNVANGPIKDAASGLLRARSGSAPDAFRDIAVLTSTGLVFLTGQGTANPPLAVAAIPAYTVTGRTLTKVAVGDVNGDGLEDVIVIAENSGNAAQLVVFPNSNGNISGSHLAPITLPGEGMTAIACDDINGDGVADVIVGGPATGSPVTEHKVFCYLGRYDAGLTATPATTNIGHAIVDLVIADYSKHRLGQKDVIVGTLEDADPAFIGSTHMAKQRVLVHQGGGVFNAAPARNLTAIELESGDGNDVFNIAVGAVARPFVRDITSSVYYLVNSAAVWLDFLAPASATNELNWMQSGNTIAGGMGGLFGKTRRIALGDVDNDGREDIVLAGANGTVFVQYNLNGNGGGVHPVGVKVSSGHGAVTLTKIQPSASVSGATTGDAADQWSFAYNIPSAASKRGDLLCKVEVQVNNGAWTTLPGGFLGKTGTTVKTTVNGVPIGWLRFRCVISSASSGLPDSYSAPSAYYRSIDSARLRCFALAYPDSDTRFNRFAHDDEFVQYYLEYRNDGTQPANNVIVAAAIPPNTTFADRPMGVSHSSGYQLNNAVPSKATAIHWNLGTVAAGASSNRFFTVRIAPNALATLKGKPIVLEELTPAIMANPPATAALFIQHLASTKSYGIYRAAPVSGLKPQAYSGSGYQIDIIPPLKLSQTISASRVSPGQVVDVRLTVKNNGKIAINNIKVSDAIESSFALEGVNQFSGTGFTGPLNTNPQATDNPSYVFNALGRSLTWSIATLAPGQKMDMDYQLRIRYDVDSQTVRNGVIEEHGLDYASFNAVGVQANGKPITAQTKLYPEILTAVDAIPRTAIPSLSFTQDCVPLVGTDASTAVEPTVRQEMLVGGENMAVIAEGGLYRVKLRYRNASPTEAKRCSITYEVPAGSEMLGFFRRSVNNGPPASDSLASNYEFFGPNGIIPAANLSTEIKKVRGIIVKLGNLPGNSHGVVDFILAAWSPPIPKAANEKMTPAGTTIRSNSAFIESDSLVLPTRGTPWQVPVFVARPVSFDIESRPNIPTVEVNGTEKFIRYLISFRNNGWFAANQVKVQASVPVGTQLVSSSLLDSNLNSQFISGTPLDSNNAPVTVGLASKVEFDIGTLASGYEDNPAAVGYAEMTVRIPAIRSANFPKDGRLKQRCEITGRDAVTNKRAQGAYALFAAPSGIVAADKVKVHSSASVSEVKALISTSGTLAKLFSRKDLPSIVRPGQTFPITVLFGNLGGQPITNATVAIQVPWGTDFVAAGTTPGFTKLSDTDTVAAKVTPNVYRWTFPTLAPHSAQSITLRVKVKNVPANEGRFLYENSAVVTGTAGTMPLASVPGNARMLVLSTNPVASAWQWFGAQLQAIGSNLFGQNNAALDNAVSNIGSETKLTCIAGADTIILDNGVSIIQLGGGNVVASGGGNLIANDGASIISNDGGGIIAAGAGNLISVGGHALTTARIQTIVAGIVASGGGNIVAAGGGNLIANDGAGLLATTATLIANDGAGFGSIVPALAGIVAAGGGNIVAAGGGNIVAAGGGNAIAASRNGAVMVATAAGFFQISSLIANDGGSLLANDGASLIAKDVAGTSSNDVGGLITK